MHALLKPIAILSRWVQPFKATALAIALAPLKSVVVVASMWDWSRFAGICLLFFVGIGDACVDDLNVYHCCEATDPVCAPGILLATA